MGSLTEEEYSNTQNQVVMLCNLIRELPLEEFIDVISRCESTAPILDPTLYIRGREHLECVKMMAVALRSAQAKMPSREDLARLQERRPDGG